MKWTPRKLRFGLNIFPPYVGAGISIDHISSDWLEADVSMKLRWYNRNAVGTHFGGSLYSMVDPQLMLMLMGALGDEYIVWDQAASIRFRKPGKGRVRASIRLSEADLERIRAATAGGEPYRPEFDLVITGENGEVVAEVHKTIYVRRKNRAP